MAFTNMTKSGVAASLILALAGCSATHSGPANDAKSGVSGTASLFKTANPPNLQTSPPIIYLADNLDEQDQLGWCIDTRGRGFGEELHAHSCKPGGQALDSDVQFSYEANSGQIKSVAYDNKCADLSMPSNESIPFGLLDCDANDAAQKFDYNAQTGEIYIRSQADMCLVAGAQSRAAGPFMSRDLSVKPCASVETALKQWVVLAN